MTVIILICSSSMQLAGVSWDRKMTVTDQQYWISQGWTCKIC